MSRLDSLDFEVENYCTKALQTSTNLEAFEKRVALVEDVLMHVGL